MGSMNSRPTMTLKQSDVKNSAARAVAMNSAQPVSGVLWTVRLRATRSASIQCGMEPAGDVGSV